MRGHLAIPALLGLALAVLASSAFVVAQKTFGQPMVVEGLSRLAYPGMLVGFVLTGIVAGNLHAGGSFFGMVVVGTLVNTLLYGLVIIGFARVWNHFR